MMMHTGHRLDRRQLLRAGTLVLLLGTQEIARGASVVAVRIWPAPLYTRVTIESDGVLKVRQTVLSDPTQLTLDIAGIDLVAGLRNLVGQIRAGDPNLAAIRVAQRGPDTVQLVLDLKQPIRPQVFHLEPVAAYQHRLVIDLYPVHAPDPLQQLISQRMQELDAQDAASERAARLLGLEGDATRNSSSPPDPNPAAPVDNRARASDPLGALMAQRAGAASNPGPTPDPAPGGARATASTRTRPATAARGSPRTERLIIVALDPGHGGEDPGAIGPGGTREKDVVLQLARRLRERINASRVNGNPMRAFMTRDTDFFVPLHVRVQQARRVQADLLVSVHANAFFTARPQGASVFALSTRGASSVAARWMEKKENAADLVGGVNLHTKANALQRALLDMSTTAQINDSLRLGDSMLGEIRHVGRLHKPRVEQANFAVLRAPDIPSVLVETAFISNPGEEQRLRNPQFQIDMAEALLRGIVRYFSQNPPLARNRQA